MLLILDLDPEANKDKDIIEDLIPETKTDLTLEVRPFFTTLDERRRRDSRENRERYPNREREQRRRSRSEGRNKK